MATPREIASQFGQTVAGLTVPQKITGAIILAITIGGLVAIIMSGTRTEYKVLFSGLSQDDAAGVIARLKEQRIEYQLAAEGSTILVPAAQVYETRLNLAGEGLPRGGGVGFEIFDQTSMGTTDFVQRLQYQRALEGELARTIRQFQAVETARVHIATPKESLFVEEERPPTASVSLKLRGGSRLEKAQIQSIVHLVASAVPGMTPDGVTLVDTNGRLLFQKEEDAETAGTSTSQIEYQTRIEQVLRKKVEDMLEGVVGPNKVVARVTAEVDFSRRSVTEENFDPESQAVRSEQLLTERTLGEGEPAAGIPGVKGSLATTTAEADSGAVAGRTYFRNNVTRNYEISRITRQILGPTGSISRLSVAVMVDGTYRTAEEDGKPVTRYEARASDEMKRFESLVKNAIGYNEERGDQVEVVNLPFASMEKAAPTPVEVAVGLGERFAMPVAAVLIAALFILFVIRPFLRVLLAKAPAPRPVPVEVPPAPPVSAEVEEGPALPKARPLTDKERMHRLAQTDPDRAADLVRKWLREEYQ
ncbi:MAG: flagellar basal-body MS-ring/collar protein FliF [Thermodesulfobacteriota bacterium]